HVLPPPGWRDGHGGDVTGQGESGYRSGEALVTHAGGLALAREDLGWEYKGAAVGPVRVLVLAKRQRAAIGHHDPRGLLENVRSSVRIDEDRRATGADHGTHGPDAEDELADDHQHKGVLQHLLPARR